MTVPIQELLSHAETRRQIQKVSDRIRYLLRNHSRWNSTQVISSAYLLYKVRVSQHPFSASYQDFEETEMRIPSEIWQGIQTQISAAEWEALQTLLPQYAPDIFAGVIFLQTEEERGPVSLERLAQAILQCSAGESVADLYCGDSSFSLCTSLVSPESKFTGYEIDEQKVLIARIQAEFLERDIEICIQDPFETGGENQKYFDKIFSNLRYEVKWGENHERVSPWEWVQRICERLKTNGKAVVILRSGSVWNSWDMEKRKNLLQKGWIECVIVMPERLLPYTDVSTVMLVLSQGHTKVRFVDASQMCQTGRRKNELTAENIQQILRAMETDGTDSLSVGMAELEKEAYSLNIDTYRMITKEVLNGVPLEMVTESIRRGAMISARKMDVLMTEKRTDIQYLSTGHLQDGVVEEDIPFLTEEAEEYARFFLQDQDLILSKNASIIKSAVVPVQEGQKILVNGNFYIIRLKKDRIHPYFLQAFFESEQGELILKYIAEGSVLPNISAEKLKKIRIPLPSMEEQEEIARRYLEAAQNVMEWKEKWQQAIQERRGIYEQYSRGRAAESDK